MTTVAQFTRQQLDERIQGYLLGAQAIIVEHFKCYPNLRPDKLVVDPNGRRYLRIWSINDSPLLACTVFAFIDTTNGDILKPASWRAPAKHARGNVFDDNFGLSRTSSYGPNYLK